MPTLQRPSRASRSSRGQTLAEFAIVIPIVLLLFMGIFDLARAAYTLNTVGDAARNGVREAIVNQTCPDVVSRAKSVAPGIDLSASNSVRTSIYLTSIYSAGAPKETCAGGLSGNYGIGWLAEVKVVTTFAPITPIIGNIVGPLSLSSTARLPIERAYP